MSSSSSGPTSVEVPKSGSPDPDDGEDILGTTLQDTYVLDRIIGEGGMGRVYESHHKRMQGKRYAIKVLRSEMAGSPEVRKRFQREADAAASIHHPNVVTVNDFGYAPDGRPFLVCEYLEGVGLSQYIKQRQRLSVDEAVHIGRKVCQGLAAAHERGVIHRDLKPENVHLVGSPERPEVKVLDFGLSRFMEGTGSHVTRTGIVMGTPAYMAPEQARGERADSRVDIYGVGAILYSALTGHAPFEEDSPQQAILKVMSAEPERPRALAPNIPEELELVVQRAMAREPYERYQTMEELDAALSVFDPSSRIALPALDSQPRTQLYSRVGSMGDEVEIGSARTQVVLWLALGVTLLLLALTTTIFGVEALFWGTRPLSATEFALVLAAVVGTLITPAALLVRHLRKRLWNNSVRVVELLPKLRGPIITAAAVYGIIVLAGRTFDGCAVLLQKPDAAPDASGWAGWSAVLTALALLSALAVFTRRRFLTSTSGFLRRMIMGPGLLGTVVVASLVLLQAGYRSRSRLVAPAPEPGISAVPAGVGPAPFPAPAGKPAVAGSVVAAAGSAAIADARAPRAELEKASTEGVDALRALLEKYPRDPDVLEPLVLALARQPDGYSKSMEAMDTLFSVAPSKIKDKALSSLVVKAALTPGEASVRAFDVMGERMGELGPDMLYDLMLTAPGLRRAAHDKLENAEVKKHFSPALAVAYELRMVARCEDRLPLLDRAKKFGDTRSVAVLMGLGTGSRRGCGKRNRSPCPAPCAAQASLFKKTAIAIQDRLQAAKH
jgi:tRNA A-37 threonylcarbamoyl transferase component Bud32